MEIEDSLGTRIVLLNKEMDSIHLANKSYWDNKEPGQRARSEYQDRLERLEQIRKELQKCRWAFPDRK
jgi:hypothetical protein